MEFLGIGPLELMFILVIILLVLGPKDIEKTARNLGRLLNRVYRSPNYNAIRHASQELRNLPQRLAREAQLDELREMEVLKQVQKDLKDTANTIGAAQKPFQAWVEELRSSPTKTPPALPDGKAPAAPAPQPPAPPVTAAPQATSATAPAPPPAAEPPAEAPAAPPAPDPASAPKP